MSAPTEPARQAPNSILIGTDEYALYAEFGRLKLAKMRTLWLISAQPWAAAAWIWAFATFSFSHAWWAFFAIGPTMVLTLTLAIWGFATRWVSTPTSAVEAGRDGAEVWLALTTRNHGNMMSLVHSDMAAYLVSALPPASGPRPASRAKVPATLMRPSMARHYRGALAALGVTLLALVPAAFAVAEFFRSSPSAGN